MFAIVMTGGKQYKVTVGTTFNVEKLDTEAGKKVVLDAILTSDGKTVLTGKNVKAKVTCQVVEHGRDDKIVVFKYKPKKREAKTHGHRQPYTTLKVLEIK